MLEHVVRYSVNSCPEYVVNSCPDHGACRFKQWCGQGGMKAGCKNAPSMIAAKPRQRSAGQRTSQKMRLAACRVAPLVVQHAAEVAQVIAAAKDQAPLFAPRTAPAETTSPPPLASVYPQPVATTEATVSAPQLPRAAGEDAKAAAQAQVSPADVTQHPESLSPTEAAERALEVGRVLQVQAQQAQQAQQAPQAPQAPQASDLSQAAAGMQPPAIKRRAVKPITLAQGSSAFQRRPAIAPATLPSPSAIAPDPATAPAATASPSTAPDPASATPVTRFSLAGPTTIVSAEAAPATAQAPSGMAFMLAGAVTKPVTTLPQIKSASSALSGKPVRAIASALPQSTALSGRPAQQQPREVPHQSIALNEDTCAQLAADVAVVSHGQQQSSISQQEPNLAAVNRLRAGFTLPFAAAPAEDRSAKAKQIRKEAQESPSTSGDLQEIPGRAVTGEGIRAVVDALHADQPQGPGQDETETGAASRKRKGSMTICLVQSIHNLYV